MAIFYGPLTDTSTPRAIDCIKRVAGFFEEVCDKINYVSRVRYDKFSEEARIFGVKKT